MTSLVLLPQQLFRLQSLSVKKPNIPITNLLSETKGPTWNRYSSHIVLTPIIRLGGVDGSWFKTKTGNFSVYLDSTSGKTVAMATALRVSFCFFYDVHLWSKFQKHCFNIPRDIVYSVFYHFQLEPPMTSSLIIQKHEYL